MSERIVLIDGHSILNRAFYGVPDLTNIKGFHTNAIYGFLNILFKILEEEKPDYLCVAFDRKEKTFRHEIFKQYKGTRKPMPLELHEQVPVLKELLDAMQIRTVECPGYEADDLLGSLANNAQEMGIEVTLVSGDRDLLQIASDHIKIRIPKTKGGKTVTEDYYSNDVIDKYQVNPKEFIDLKALMGDTADNIPGVPKVGEKTATQLMIQFGSLENIYDHLEEINKKSIYDTLKENKDLAFLSRVLATIKTDCELCVHFEETRIRDFYTEKAYELFQDLEFKNYLQRFDNQSIKNDDVIKSFTIVEELSQCEDIFSKAEKEEKVAFYIISEENTLLSLSLALGENNVYVIKVQGFLTSEYLCGKLQNLKEKTMLITFDCKRAYRFLNQPPQKNIFDVLIASYLINPLKNDYCIEDVAKEHLNLMIPDKKLIFSKISIKDAIIDKENEFSQLMGLYAYTLFMSYNILVNKLNDQGMFSLFQEIEMPLSKVLFNMEQEGILINKEELVNYGKSLEGRISELEQLIYKSAGINFNINSPKQLGEILFDKMGLPGGKKTKTGFSTAADVLEKLSVDYPIVADILEYRGLAKLKSTYAEGLASCIKVDGRIHTTFNQTITATGRISSTDPNLQNIPMRMELGRKIRKAFIPKPGYIFMDADYSQIELRLLAHISNDKELINAYKQEADIHRITASKVFHTPFDEVTDLQRRNAKAVNFGIVYGISSFGLSQDLSINRKEAAKYIEDYFNTYPDVKKFLDKTVEDAKKDGYVTTLYGRRRPIPELSSSNFMQRSFGERVAMNSPIQGTAADIMKVAMIRVYDELRNNNLKSKILIQVHDELLLEVEKSETESVRKILTREMEHAADLSVSLDVDVHTGLNWYEAK